MVDVTVLSYVLILVNSVGYVQAEEGNLLECCAGNDSNCQHNLTHRIKERLREYLDREIRTKIDEKEIRILPDRNGTYSQAFKKRQKQLNETLMNIDGIKGKAKATTGQKLDELQLQRSSLENISKTEVSEKLKQLEQEIYNMTMKKVKNIELYINEFHQNLSTLQQETELSIAFSATLSKDDNRTGNVVFDDVGLNTGNGYNGTTGIFFAPSDGYYYFACSFLVANGYVNANLLKNGNELVRGYASKGGYENTGFMSSTVELKEGDQIVVNLLPDPHTTGKLRANLYSVFSGFIL